MSRGRSALRVVDGMRADARVLERFVAQTSRSRLQQEPPFVGEPPHAHLWAEVQAAMQEKPGGSLALFDDDAPRALCVWCAREWDREHFGFPVGRIEHLVAADEAAADRALAEVQSVLRSHGVRMASARVSVTDLTAVGALERAGFHFIEHMLTPWRTLQDWSEQRSGVTRAGSLDDLPALKEIAQAIFRSDRFHLDRRFARSAADTVYVKWIESWHSHPPRGARCRVVDVDGVVLGFFLYRVFEPRGLPGRDVVDLVLGGMAPAAAGRGLGHKMYCDVLDDVAPCAQFARVTIATSNVAVVNLYVKLGFRFSSGGEVTLHKWYDE